jgi:hypothetical protein
MFCDAAVRVLLAAFGIWRGGGPMKRGVAKTGIERRQIFSVWWRRRSVMSASKNAKAARRRRKARNQLKNLEGEIISKPGDGENQGEKMVA